MIKASLRLTQKFREVQTILRVAETFYQHIRKRRGQGDEPERLAVVLEVVRDPLIGNRLRIISAVPERQETLLEFPID